MRKLAKDLSQEVETLIKEGKKKGEITYEKIEEVFKDDIVWHPYLEDFFSRASEENIKIEEPREDKIEELKEELQENAIHDESLKAYLEEISKLPVLSPQQEKELARKLSDKRFMLKQIEHELGMTIRRFKRYYKILQENKASLLPEEFKNINKDKIFWIAQEISKLEQEIESIKSRFIEGNLRLVVAVARKYQSIKVDLIDLIHEGNIGLIRAIDKFDHKSGFRFSTYAAFWIRQAILKAISELPKAIRVPTYVALLISRMIRETQYLTQKLGREPTLEEIAESMNIPVKKVILYIQASKEPISLETPVIPDEEVKIADEIEDTQILGPVEVLFLNSLHQQLSEVFNKYLNPKEKLVLKLRFGLEGNKKMTLEEIGKIIRLTRERVRQLEKHAIEKLKKLKITREILQSIHI